ncbi:hypothetical protein D1007_11723 [Hordeum vulgare]|uniref:DUF4220 domain-containing protein n=1 Tax=Hordeum vulgare subsp. vulgare TaxID=112509 RepID=A0A8I6WUJ6_HORVV|nr:uncharacterized protein LOC123431152 [Hordeum vulgare subsp. vulgare]KAE8811352.1 hypothetical protein D1007_11723 [Hordeum vulgare]
MAGGLLDLWNQFSVQILVLLSLGLQVVLFLFAGIRRHEAPAIIRFLLWQAYLMADYTAIYALGHMWLSGAARGHQLVAFWAPFLLLHLGGPDSITAYALQDNQLWLRHLHTQVVQVLGAAYVLYMNIAGGGNFLPLAAALMFAVGVVKYGERTWALRCGNLESIRSSVKKQPPAMHNHFHLQDKRLAYSENEKDEQLDEESHLRRAHSLFHICKRAMVNSSVVEKVHGHKIIETMLVNEVEQWTLMEMELSLMYDILYTKAAVIHTWPGYFIRVISPLAIVAALLLFQFSGEDTGHRKVDVAITYVLLGGALFMETISLLNALVSSWTFAFLSTTTCRWLRFEALCNERWDRLRGAVLAFHRLVTGGDFRYKSRRWSGNMGQYNMLHFCTRPDSLTSPLLGRLASVVGLKEFWNRKHYSGTVKIPTHVKVCIGNHMSLVHKEGRMNALGMLRQKWGEEPLHSNGLYQGVLKNSLGIEFQEGIIIWHIGTNLFLAMSEKAEDTLPHVKAIKVLSNYMMFLLVERPDMLPGNAQNRLYQLTCKNLKDQVQRTHSSRRKSICDMLKSLFRLSDGPESSSRATDSKELAKSLYQKYGSQKFSHDAPRLTYAARLARKLVILEKYDTADSLQVVLDVWTDILIYASNKCSRESHAKKLNSGGELTTILWLMAEHVHQLNVEKDLYKVFLNRIDQDDDGDNV